MMKTRHALLALIGGLCLAPAAGAAPVLALAATGPAYEHAVVAADHELASEAGLEMLRCGGNVVDAAVATAFALAVVRPESCGLGGGGFMLIWSADEQRAVAIDFRERAPAAATPDMFRDPANPDHAVPGLSTRGPLAVAVPGSVAGLCYAQERYGTLPLETVLAPAIRLARDGFPADPHHVAVHRRMLREFADHPDYQERFAALWEQYLNRGEPLQVGDPVSSPLADVLQRIARDGPQVFYEGEVAEFLAALMAVTDGLITLDDLADYEPIEREPIVTELGWLETTSPPCDERARGGSAAARSAPPNEGGVRGGSVVATRARPDERNGGARLYSVPPPSSGGVALVEMLHILEAYRPQLLARDLPHNSPHYVHACVEAMKHAFADRARWLGDPDDFEIPIAELTSRDYARRLAERIDPARTSPPEQYGSGTGVAPVLPEDGGTSHFSVLDASGNAVACTQTINTAYGSLLVEPRFGIVLNNEMDDFAAVPGVPNVFGLVQSDRAAVAPRRRPLSSMTPVIVVRDGRAIAVAGASGGPMIISATTQVLLNVLVFGMSPEEAVAAPRFHHQWLPDTLHLEPELFASQRHALATLGHDVAERHDLASVQAAFLTDAGVQGASDPRKGGRPAGF